MRYNGGNKSEIGEAYETNEGNEAKGKPYFVSEGGFVCFSIPDFLEANRAFREAVGLA
jgi:hypothetical protein